MIVIFFTNFICISWSVADPNPDPYHFFKDPEPSLGCLGFGSVSYSNGTPKLTGRENLTKNTCCVAHVGPIDKENQVKMYKKYCFRYISSLKQQGSGSVSNSQIRIRIRLKSMIRIRIKVKSEKQDPDLYQKSRDPQH
jgi:hypothetical protein